MFQLWLKVFPNQWRAVEWVCLFWDGNSFMFYTQKNSRNFIQLLSSLPIMSQLRYIWAQSSTSSAEVLLTELALAFQFLVFMYSISHAHGDTNRVILFCSTRPPHATLHHCALQYNKPCLKCINLLTTMVMCTLRGIPALLTSCSWNIVFILTVNWTHIKYTGTHQSTCQIC